MRQRTAEVPVEFVRLVKLARNFPQERVSERTQVFDVPMPQIAKETVKAVRVVQRERMQERTVDADASAEERDRRDDEVGFT